MLSITDSNQNGRNKLVTLTAARTGPFTGGVFVLWISDELSMFSVASLFSGNNNDTKNTDSGKLLVTMSKDAVLPHVCFGDTTSGSVHASILVCSDNVSTDSTSRSRDRSHAGRIAVFTNRDAVADELKLYMCPTIGCMALTAATDGELTSIIGAIMTVRENIFRETKDRGMPAALQSALLPMKRVHIDVPIKPRSYSRLMDFKIAGRSVCQYCYAFVADQLICHVGHLRYGRVWDAVRKAICAGVSVETHKAFRMSTSGECSISTNGPSIPLSKSYELYNTHETKMLLWLHGHLGRGYGEISAVDGQWHAQYCTKKIVQQQYNEVCEVRCLPDETMTERQFRKAIAKLSKVPFHPPGASQRMLIHWSQYSAFGKCTYCMTLIQNIKCTLRPDLRGAWLAQLRNHREDAYTEKLHFYDSREQALNDKTRVVSGQDNLDHSKLRMVNLGAYLKGHGADDVMFVHATLGVVTVAGGGHYFYLADPTVPDNGNLTIEMLQLTLQQLQLRRETEAAKQGHTVPPVMVFDNQVDGCRVNKNKIKFAYQAWLVQSRQVGQAADNYMLVGHTHDLMDAVLAIVSKKIKEGLVIKRLQVALWDISPVSCPNLTCISLVSCPDLTCISPVSCPDLTCISLVSHLYLTCISLVSCPDPTCISLVSHLHYALISLVSCPVSHLYLTCIVP